jgi:tRNA threonylcarbamoyladenosine biosynthesis protein TsaB
MIILGIDTSSTDLSVSLCVNGAPLASVDRYVKNAHAEHIAQTVAAVLRLGGAEAGDVKHIAVSTGPGSFTGLRIGLSFVKGFCVAAERSVLPLSSLLVLAHASAACGGGLSQRIFTALDARQGRVHWGGFVCDRDGDKMSLRRLTEDRLSTPEELLGELSQNDLLVTDAMGYQRSAVFGAFAGAARIIDARKSSLRRGLSCASIAFDRIVNKDGYDNDELRWLSAMSVVPNYLQASAAEEKRALCT